jgi:uncharacterized protein (DUF433 family)
MKFEHIICNEAILGGKPIIRNTRLSVDFILELLASGGSIPAIVAAYPQLSEAAVKEAVQYATQFLHNEIYLEIKSVA